MKKQKAESKVFFTFNLKSFKLELSVTSQIEIVGILLFCYNWLMTLVFFCN